MHDDELPIDTDLVRRLVASSFPDHADLHITRLAASGSSNALFRLGPEMLVRLPRQPGGSATIEKEARWLPLISTCVSAPVPDLIGLGAPGHGYPETWALTRWIDGKLPDVPSDSFAGGSSRALGLDLAGFVTELAAIAVPDPARSDPALRSYRGGRLADTDEEFHEWIAACRELPDLGLDLDRALAVWEKALDAERSTEQGQRWFHGDLFAENLLVRDGRLAAVLDFGGLAVGDGVVDLAVAWEVLDDEGRDAFFSAVDATEGVRLRSMGWALAIAFMTFPYYWLTMPERCADRRWMAAAVLSGESRLRS